MSWRLTVFTGVAALACAVFVFEFKGTVRDIDKQITATNRDIEQQTWRLQTLRADYAYLTRPDRLAMQAAQLDMVPGTTRALSQITSIAFDSNADQASPTSPGGGESAKLRAKTNAPARSAAPADASPAAARNSGAVASQDAGDTDREQVATATPARNDAASAKAASAASVRAAEAAKATKAAQAALAARIAQATSRRTATVKPQASSPAPMWAGSPSRQNNLP